MAGNEEFVVGSQELAFEAQDRSSGRFRGDSMRERDSFLSDQVLSDESSSVSRTALTMSSRYIFLLL